MGVLGVMLTALLAITPAAAQTRADRLWTGLMSRAPARIFVQAHRGDHESAPENSLRAFDDAVAAGVDIIELDVRRTRDGVLVIMHDPRVNRTTSGEGAVADLTFAQIEAMRLRGPGGAVMHDRVPTLPAALAKLRGRALVTVDIKDERLEVVPDIVATVRAAGMERRVLYYADNLAALELVRADDPQAFVLPLAQQAGDIAPLLARFGGAAVHLKPRYVTRALVDDLRRQQVISLVNVIHAQRTATDDLDEGYEAMAEAGVSIIQTNRPSSLLPYLNRRRLHVDVR
jgi:glycerophosphoryl diester phosphodiesterase